MPRPRTSQGPMDVDRACPRGPAVGRWGWRRPRLRRPGRGRPRGAVTAAVGRGPRPRPLGPPPPASPVAARVWRGPGRPRALGGR
eukprot:472808-Lingulodinium_polyedra.AAC.1